MDHKVKAIRCDNGTKFKNRIMNEFCVEFCEMKGIRREFSFARTQQNGYSIDSKAFRVFNTRTRFVEENLHINFLENKPNVTGTEPNWMFDIDTLTMTSWKKTVPGPQCVLLLLLTSNSQGLKRSEHEVADDARKKSTKVPRKENGFQDLAKEYDNNDQENDLRDQEEALKNNVNKNLKDCLVKGREREQRNEFESMFGQDKDANGNSTYRIFTPVSAAGYSYVNLGKSIPVNVATLPNVDLPTNPLKPDLNNTADLQDTRIFSGAYDDEFEDVVADFNNLELTTVVSPIPTTMINKDHPKEQIIRDPLLAPKTRRMTKISQEHAMILVDLPKGKHAIRTKWVYRNKKDERGIVVRNKARLVAQGYTQEGGIDYDEVFALVARIEAIKLFLAYASFMGFIVYQMDVKSAFLYDTIEEEVYVFQPPRFEDPYFPNKVYKVEKALYGLHQAPRAWYETLSTYLLENRFRREIIDKTVFIKKDKGLQAMQRDDGIYISQDKYVADILKKFDFSLVKTANTLIETHKPLLKDEEAEDVDVYLYRLMIGLLMYLTASRPDIMDSPFDLEAFLDSDYARASLDRTSTTGGCQFLRKRLISWQCKKQTVVANSTTEAEYVSAANCCGHVLWIQNQMLDYGFNFMNTKIYIDNESIICIVKNPVYHSKTKHIEIRHQFIRDSYEKRLIQVIKRHTDQNFADLLIKAFDVSRFNFLIASIGLLNL
nr:hypothetical protein [Tanacetum cinerariifolium]